VQSIPRANARYEIWELEWSLLMVVHLFLKNLKKQI
jgi:hypothetical protein